MNAKIVPIVEDVENADGENGVVKEIIPPWYTDIYGYSTVYDLCIYLENLTYQNIKDLTKWFLDQASISFQLSVTKNIAL